MCSRHPTGAKKAGVQRLTSPHWRDKAGVKRDHTPAGGGTPSLHPLQPVHTGRHVPTMETAITPAHGSVSGRPQPTTEHRHPRPPKACNKPRQTSDRATETNLPPKVRRTSYKKPLTGKFNFSLTILDKSQSNRKISAKMDPAP